MTIDLVVFDMAGTTVFDGDAVNICLRRALNRAGVEVSRDAVNAVMGEPKPVAIAKLLAGSGARTLATDDPAVRTIYQSFETLMLEHYRADPMVRAADRAAETFAELKRQGIRVALDTGFNRVIADAILTRLGWATGDLVDAVVTSDEVARGRPYPDLIERAMALTGVRSALSVAKVGDTPADLHEGAAAGCALIIGVTTGSHTRASLESHPHTHLVERLDEVPPLCVQEESA